MRKVRPFPAAPRLPRHNLRPRRRSSKTLLLCHRISIGVNWKLPGLENCCGSDKQKLAGGVRSRPPRPGPFGPLYAESLPPAAFRALRALLLCAKGLRPLDSTGRTNLKTTTNNLRLKLERRKESFRAEENQRQSGKMSLLIFSGLTPGFAVRFAHSMPAKLAARKRWAATLFLVAFATFTATNTALSGSLSGIERERPRSFSPSNFCFSITIRPSAANFRWAGIDDD